jgi:amino-acid N-acetyltransferase
MSSTTITLQQTADLDYVERLLDSNDLPTSDVREKPDSFYVALDGDDYVGIGGLEIYGEDGLLRSVVVEERVRGEGLGTALCDALEREAREQGVDTLYLLTTTAADFFASRGYAEIDRSDPPAAIRDTPEFDDLCPDTATCMKTSL